MLRVKLLKQFFDIVDRIPPSLRDEWDPDAKLEKPKVDFEVEWVYGYRGKEPSGGRNIYHVSTIKRKFDFHFIIECLNHYHLLPICCAIKNYIFVSYNYSFPLERWFTMLLQLLFCTT